MRCMVRKEQGYRGTGCTRGCTATSGKSTATMGAKRCTVRVHEGLGRVDVRGLYPATKGKARWSQSREGRAVGGGE